jgi:hypothetical protein
MFNIENIENKIKKLDSLLITFYGFIKRHWLMFIISLVGYFIYWSLTTTFHDEYYFNRDGEMESMENITEIPYIINSRLTYYEGTQVLIYLWSDGYETLHNLDGSPYTYQ